MFSRVRKHLTYANVAMTLAFVFAMSGGAYAASKYVITSTKQIKPSVLASLKGAAGKTGSAGAAGPAGAQGPQGPAGGKGENGANGTNGTSVTSSESKSKIGPCKEGGSAFTAGSTTTYACNGEKGKEGTFGGSTLPEGKTLTGVWGASGYGEAPFPKEGVGYLTTGVSFALPLSSLPLVHLIQPDETNPTGCSGTAAEPAAEPGNLCLFVTNLTNTILGQGYLHGQISGFTISGFTEAKGSAQVEGTWAVTGG